MKSLNIILKVLSALATVAGIVYLIATYGDKIVAWAKDLMAKCPCNCEEAAEAEETVEEATEEAVEETVEEAPASEEVPAEAPAEEAPAAEDNAPVADEEDFEA